MKRLYCYKQNPSIKLLLWITLILLICSYKELYSQVTPPTAYPCDYRNYTPANCSSAPPECTFPANVEKGCNCFDGINNDGDGVDANGNEIMDARDPDCAAYYGLAFVGEGSDCSITPPGANTPFDLVGAPVVSGQNTSDTQSKIAAGDVDGNGTPDVVITSKWNSEVRLVSTTTSTGVGAFGGDNFAPGDVMADYNADGSKSDFPNCDGEAPKNLLFEHEVLIADIDRDGDAEIFAIVSNRKGSPTSAPVTFYLLVLTIDEYGPGGLVPLYPAVCLGKNRPGIFGIADMDGDGNSEIYIRDRIFAAETGKLLASPSSKLMTGTGTDDWDTNVNAASVAVDIKSAGADGSKMELVVGAQIYQIPSLTNRNPASPAALTLWRNMNSISFDVTGEGTADQYFVKITNDPSEYGVDTHGSTSVADIDKDGYVDVVLSGAVNSTAGRTAIFYWNVQDNTVTGMLTPSATELGMAPAHPDYTNYQNGWIWGTGRVNIGDANGDGNLDLSFVAGNQLFCLTTNTSTNRLTSVWTQNQLKLPSTSGTVASAGAVFFGYRSINDSRSGILTVTIYDFDNDGEPELVYRDSQELNVIDGPTGTVVEFSRICQSHTYTEGPIIADVNGDGDTDIACACNRNDGGLDITKGIQQQALGEVRIWYSSGEWLPTRSVWNQPGYFVVNINDDLTLPFPQLDIASIFGNAPCPNGIPGPNMPYNVFLNQVPFLSANGCPVFPAPDLEFVGFDPEDPRLDPNDPSYDPSALPTVFVDPNICGNVDLKVALNINNTGDLPISATIPVSFFRGSPYDPANPFLSTGPTDPDSVLLFTTSVILNNLQVGDTLSVGDILDANGNVIHAGDLPFIQFDGPGSAFELYVVLYNDGSVLPIDTTAVNPGGQVQSGDECDITNNFWPIMVNPKPFTVNIDSLDNVKCLPTSPNSGELISHISVGPDTVIDLSPYGFQWLMADQVTPVSTGLPGVVDTEYNLTELPAGDYYLVITNTEKGCASSPILGQVVDGLLAIPGDTVILVSNQTSCEPPNGSLQAEVIGADIANYEFAWEDAGGPIGVTGPLLSGVKAGTYTVIITETSSGCQTDADGIIGDLTQEPDVVASAVDVVNCIAPSSGEVTATAFFNGVAQDSVGYVFDWYLYDKATNTRGSILPTSNGNPTVKGLPIGYYEVVITQIATGCKEANTAPDTIEIKDMTFLPEARLTRLAPQTSCDPLLPNGQLQADAYVNGVLQPPGSFTFEWFEGQGTVIPHTGGTSGINGQIGENLKGGGQSYTIRITNVNNCPGIADTTLAEIISYPIVTLGTTPNSVCDVGLGYTGSVSVATLDFNGSPVTLPDANYTLTWYNGSIVHIDSLRGADQNNTTITQLDSGFYTLVVENTLLHCPSIANVEQVLSIKALPVITADADSSTNCKPIVPGNGRVKLTAVDGAAVNAANYDFRWHRGTNPVTSPDPIGLQDVAMVDTLQGKSPNNFFTVFVRNQTSGCENTRTVEVLDAKVLPILSSLVTPDNICDIDLVTGGITRAGAVDATIDNQGITPLTDYTFSWDAQFPDINLSGVTGPSATQLDSGYYEFFVRQISTGCESNITTRFVPTTTAFPIIQTLGTASFNCPPTPGNGQAEVTDIDGNGLVGSYSYQWYTSSDTTNNEIVGETGAVLDNVQGGVGVEFTVRVIDHSNGCASTAIEQVIDIHRNPIITLAPTPNDICNSVLAGTGYTGEVTSVITNLGVSPLTGALADYEFTWVDISEGNILLKDGITGGVNGGESLLGVDSSDYSLQVVHTLSGCVSNLEVATVTLDIVLPDIETGTVSSTNCLPQFADGSGFITTIDGINQPGGNFSYQWYYTQDTTGTILEDSTDFVIQKLQGGTDEYYTVLVTNLDDGCQNVATVKILDAKTRPLITLDATDNTQCEGTPNGTAFLQTIDYKGVLLTNPDPFAGFTFGWKFGSATATTAALSSRPQGTYKLAVTSNVGCTSDTVQVDINDAFVFPNIIFSKLDQTSCDNTNLNGRIAAGVDLMGTPGYSFDWFTDAAATTPLPAINVDPSEDSVAINLPGNLFYTTVVQNTTTFCADTATTFLREILRIPVIAVAATAIADCNTPGFVDAAVSVDLDDDNVLDPIDMTNAGNISRYLITWYRGTTDADPVLPTDITDPDRLDELSPGVDLPVGNYAAFVIDDVTKCASQVEFDFVNGPPPLFSIATHANFRPPSCGEDLGAFTAYVTTGGPTITGYTFEWYQGAPVDPSATFYTDPPVQFTTATPIAIDIKGVAGGVDGVSGVDYSFGPLLPLPPGMQAPTSATSGPTLFGVESGTYTVVVTDGNGCKEYLQSYLPFSTEPVILVADIIPTECNLDNGEVGLDVDVSLTGNTINQYKLWLLDGSNPVLTPPASPSPFRGLVQPATGNTLTDRFTGLGDGVYTVVAQEDPAAGLAAGCFSAPVTFTMVSALPPNLSALAFNANSNCASAPLGDGSMEITFAMREDDPYHPNYVPQPTPPASFPVFPAVTYTIDVFDVDDASTTNMAGPFSSGDIVNIPNLESGEFDITINSSVGCSITERYTIGAEPVVAELVEGDLVIDDALKCDPDGAIEIATIGIVGGGVGVIDEYEFRWYNNSTDAQADANEITSGQGDSNPDVGGDYFDAAALTRPPGVYWVVAEKTIGVGSGCLSAPFSGEIKDLSVNPTAELAVFSNTACVNPLLPPVFEGSITLTVTHPGSEPATTGYSYTWLDATASSNLMAAPGAGDGDGDGSEPDDDNPTGLETGYYQVVIKNLETGCETTSEGTIDQTELPVIISDATHTDQVICDPDGSVTVLEVLVNNVPAPIGDFDFFWYRGATSTPTVLTGTGEVLLDPTTYVDPGDGSVMGAGTYNVVAVRTQSSDGGPGYGCPSPQKTETVLDVSEKPVIALTPFVNTSCSTGTFEGSIQINVTDEGSAPAGALGYQYTWTQLPLPGSIPDSDGNDGDGDGTEPDGDNPGGLIDGTYKMIARNNVTGCLSNETEAVITPAITPVIIAQKDFLDRFVCDFAGRAFVTEVTVQSATPITYNQINPPIPVGAAPFSTDILFSFYEGVPLADNSNLVYSGLGESHLDSLRLPGILPTAYYVVAQNKSGPGLDCKSVAERIDISDRSTPPEFQITPLSNTSCDLTVFDGSLEINVTNPGSVSATTGYDYVWVSTPVASPLANSIVGNDADNFDGDGGAVTNLDGDNPVSLIDGDYTLFVTNAVSNCASPNVTATIDISGRPNIALSLIANDRFYCVESGKVIVTSVTVGAATFNNTQFNPQFSFEFFEGGISGTPVLSGVNQFQLDSMTYANADVTQELKTGVPYTVVVTNNSGIGLNCESVPTTIQIEDRHVNPIPQVATIANSSCGAFQNGSIMVTVSETQGPGVGGLYTYDFDVVKNIVDIDSRYGASGDVQGNNGNGVNLPENDNDSIPNLPVNPGNLPADYYFSIENEITRCSTPVLATVSYDPVASKPNIVDVITNLPVDCRGTGGDAQVTAITIGNGPSITGSPALDPPNFEYDWYDNATDAFNPTPPAGNIPTAAPTTGRFAAPLEYGTYYVSVRHLQTNCRSTPVEIFIDSADVVRPHIVITQTSLQLSCNEVALGGTASLNALADGQDDTNLDYSFNWFNNLIASPPVYAASTDSIGDLISGNYSVEVIRTSTGCASEAFFVIPDLDPKFLPTIALSGDDQTSCLVDNGSIVVRVLPFPAADNGLTYEDTFKDPITGVPVYDFDVDLYNGNQLGAGLGVEPAPIPPDKNNILVLPFSPDPGSFISDTLGISIYTIRLLDRNTGCIIVDTTSVLDNRRDPVPVIVVENPLTNCDTRLNGQLSATAGTQPVGDYDFYWWSAANPPPAGDTISFSNKLIGQDQGSYQVLIVNKVSGCDAIGTEAIPTNQKTIFEPTIDLLQAQTICWENFYPPDPLARPNGWVSANVQDTVLGYRFNWYTGQFDHDGIIGLTPDTTGLNFLHLTGEFGSDPGVYTVSAVDLKTGCWAVNSIVVPDERVIPIGLVETTPSFCSDASTPTGSAIVKLTNEENLSFRDISWFDDRSNAPYGGGTQIFGIPPGFYRAEFLTTQFCYGEAIGEVMTEIRAYNLVSSNGDNENDTWVIDCISNYTVAGGAKQDNNIKIFNRYGVLIFEIDGYNNADKVFRGIGENGLYSFGNDLPDGTYFYIIDKRNGTKPIVGYLELVR